MEDKICVEVMIPSVNKSYDFVLSSEISAGNAAEYIMTAIKDYEGQELDTRELILCDIGGKRVLEGELSLRQNGIKDGSRLMVV